MKRSLLVYVIKNAIGATVAVLIAKAFKLTNVMTAGVIVLLSIQNTRQESIKIAAKRLTGTFIALTIALFIFKILSFKPYAFGVFLLIYIPLLIKFGLQDGLVVNSVLVTHLIIDQDISFAFLVNELVIMIIGLMVALVLNLYMPSVEEHLDEAEQNVEQWIRDTLKKYVELIKKTPATFQDADSFFVEGEKLVQEAVHQAYLYYNNQILIREDYHMAYVYMRKAQIDVLKHAYTYLIRLSMTHAASLKVADFTEKVSESIGVENRAKPLLEELKALKEEFKTWELPKTRDEFENRAMLFQYLNDMERFLDIKNHFHHKYQFSKLHLKRIQRGIKSHSR